MSDIFKSGDRVRIPIWLYVDAVEYVKLRDERIVGKVEEVFDDGQLQVRFVDGSEFDSVHWMLTHELERAPLVGLKSVDELRDGLQAAKLAYKRAPHSIDPAGDDPVEIYQRIELASVALINAQDVYLTELERLLQEVTDIAVINLHNVFANSGRDGYNAWYFIAPMEAHEKIAQVLGVEKWSLLYEAQDRDAAKGDGDGDV